MFDFFDHIWQTTHVGLPQNLDCEILSACRPADAPNKRKNFRIIESDAVIGCMSTVNPSLVVRSILFSSSSVDYIAFKVIETTALVLRRQSLHRRIGRERIQALSLSFSLCGTTTRREKMSLRMATTTARSSSPGQRGLLVVLRTVAVLLCLLLTLFQSTTTTGFAPPTTILHSSVVKVNKNCKPRSLIPNCGSRNSDNCLEDVGGRCSQQDVLSFLRYVY
jgi:hypothetical protein